MAEEFAECTREEFLVDGMHVERRHNKGWPFIQAHFIYTVTATWGEIVALGLSDGIHLPEGRKRSIHGSFGAWESWSLYARKGQRWELMTRRLQSDPIIERLVQRGRFAALPARGHLRLVWSADWASA